MDFDRDFIDRCLKYGLVISKPFVFFEKSKFEDKFLFDCEFVIRYKTITNEEKMILQSKNDPMANDEFAYTDFECARVISQKIYAEIKKRASEKEKLEQLIKKEPEIAIPLKKVIKKEEKKTWSFFT
jgi:hypothetical protein